jgi:hypothetical protein
MADDEAAKKAKSQVTKGLASDKGDTIKQLTSSGRSAKEYRSPAAKADRDKAYAAIQANEESNQEEEEVNQEQEEGA